MKGIIIALVIPILTLEFLTASPVSRRNLFPLQSSSANNNVQRNPRSAKSPDYVMEVFINAHFGLWKWRNCDVLYNCRKVSPLHCTKNISHFFFSDEPLPKPCSLDFYISLDNTSITTGVDLALYKATEPTASNDIYEIWFFVASSADDSIVVDALTTTVSSSCSGWQMFHLNKSVMSQFLQPGVNLINFEILIFKNDEYYSLPCDEVHSLFVFNATAHRARVPSITPSPLNTTTQTPTSGSLANLNPFGKKDEDLESYTPVLNVFQERQMKRQIKRRWTKREAKLEQVKGQFKKSSEGILSRHKSCEILDNWVTVNTTYWVNGKEFPVMAPRIYNAKHCKIKEGYSGTCQPIEEKPLVLLLKSNSDSEIRGLKHMAPELKIVEKCG